MLDTDPPAASISHIEREAALQRVLAVWITTGLLFMLIPGTFLGVWNLVSISGKQSAATISPAWIQAHGHAQLFGWIGSFIIGIGFYSLSKMAKLAPFQVSRAWWSWGLWTAGVALRWVTNLYSWHWRVLLPASALLELAAFAIFFRTVSHHQRDAAATAERLPFPIWMWLVIGSTVGFLVSLLANFASVLWLSFHGSQPAIPQALDQRLLTLFLWGYIVPAIWGFSSRWLPVFLGLAQPTQIPLLGACFLALCGLIVGLIGAWLPACIMLTVAALLSVLALHLAERAARPAKISGVHFTFPYFVRVAYGWLVIGSSLSIWAAVSDHSGGIWGASRHALTVGFISMMVFSVGQRVLPAFCGMRVLYSSRLMFLSLALLTVGCTMRVTVEPLAYEGYIAGTWPLLPISALTEMAAFTIFAVNLAFTLAKPPEHIRLHNVASSRSAPAMSHTEAGQRALNA